jgi:hypothetical protein
VYTTVSPVEINGRVYYRVTTARRDGVAKFGPPIHESTIFESGDEFRNLFLTKSESLLEHLFDIF